MNVGVPTINSNKKNINIAILTEYLVIDTTINGIVDIAEIINLNISTSKSVQLDLLHVSLRWGGVHLRQVFKLLIDKSF